MDIRIGYDRQRGLAIVERGASIQDHVWSRISTLLLTADREAAVSRNSIQTQWIALLDTVPELATLRDKFKLELEYDDEARALLLSYQQDRQSRESAADSLHGTIAESQVQRRLDEIGFRRTLTNAQVRDISRLVSLRHGANFSVPGAGKTTVALAVHMLLAQADTRLFVVAPKNAFVAWDEAVEECLGKGREAPAFVRLSGGADKIRSLLSPGPRFAIINYEQLVANEWPIRTYLERNKVHLIADESHRIKAGVGSQRGAALLGIAHLPVRRDALTGTPLPHSISDLIPQLRFLWPGQDVTEIVSDTGVDTSRVAALYVRTTKSELGLPPVDYKFEKIPMSGPQVTLYGIFRREALRRLAGIRTSSNIDIDSARRSIIRLVMIASNPVAVVRNLTNDRPLTFSFDDPRIGALFRAVVEEEDSPKILRVCEIARMLASSGKKSVIWTNFRYNVARIERLLADLGAVSIHGGVNTGSIDDPETREGRVRAFQDRESGCYVLVAIPAAGGEGISLHHACHDAIYVDRTYNAGHFLQSVDRIHRLGLPPNTVTTVTILESIAPSFAGSIDYSVRRRLATKIETMGKVLDDKDLRQLSLDEEQAELPSDPSITPEDLVEILDDLEREAAADTDAT